MIDRFPIEAVVFATYPFVILTGIMAAFLTGRAALQLRNMGSGIVAWWLLVGISLGCTVLVIDSLWVLAWRLQDYGVFRFGEWANRANPATWPFHAFMRMVSAIAVWIYVITALCILWNKRGGSIWIKDTLRKTLLIGGIAYLGLVMLLYWQMSDV